MAVDTVARQPVAPAAIAPMKRGGTPPRKRKRCEAAAETETEASLAESRAELEALRERRRAFRAESRAEMQAQMKEVNAIELEMGLCLMERRGN